MCDVTRPLRFQHHSACCQFGSRMFAETTFAVLIVPWLSNEQIRSVVVETGGKLPLNRIQHAYSASRGDGPQH